MITALRDADGELVGFAKVTRDLDRARADAEDAALERRPLRLLVESVRDYAIFMLDPDGHVLTWNAGAERIKGYTRRRDHRPALLARSTPPEDHRPPASPSTSCDAPRASGRFEDEGWRVRKDGTRFWANVVITALRDADGRAARLRQGHPRPDRAARRPRRRSAPSEERFRLLVEGVQDYAIFMLDPRGPWSHLERRRASASRATAPRRSSGSTSRCSTPAGRPPLRTPDDELTGAR